MGTWIVGIILVCIVAAIILKMRKDKKNGKGGCSCGSDCGSCGCGCHHDD